MSKQVRLRDFQVYPQQMGLSFDEHGQLNEALFSTYEPLRLWRKAARLTAPCGKIVVTLCDETSMAPWHGHVTNAIGICEVTEAVELSTFRRSAGDHRWVLGRVLHALGCIARETAWRSTEFEQFIAELTERDLPLRHYFDRLAKVDRANVRCVPLAVDATRRDTARRASRRP